MLVQKVQGIQTAECSGLPNRTRVSGLEKSDILRRPSEHVSRNASELQTVMASTGIPAISPLVSVG